MWTLARLSFRKGARTVGIFVAQSNDGCRWSSFHGTFFYIMWEMVSCSVFILNVTMYLRVQSACWLSIPVQSSPASFNIDFKPLLSEGGGGLNCLGQRCREWRRPKELTWLHATDDGASQSHRPTFLPCPLGLTSQMFLFHIPRF